MMTIYWAPTIHQVGDHTVIIDAFDGLEHANIYFQITVEEISVEPEGDGDGSNVALIVIILMIVILLLIGAGVGIFLFLRSKQQTSEETVKEENAESNQSLRSNTIRTDLDLEGLK
jgi:heme/copper-type cytochrome/quinol oxidase subunit 2